MLYEFIVMHREDIVTRARERVRSRPWPSVSSREIEYGVPLFDRTGTPATKELQ